MKIGLKNIMRRRTTHLEDMTPEAVIFTVDLFNSIYMATCMQRASSLLTVTVIMVVDLSLTIIMLYGIHHRTATALGRLKHSENAQESDNMLDALCFLCRDLKKVKKQTRGEIRIYSCLPYKLQAADERLMALLGTIPLEKTSKADTIQPTPNGRNCGMRALYQLAFVLETQMSLVQGKLMFWMLITLCFRLVHFGT
ncbi:hypothetical protein L915_07467 [Phytophthora nicotianae]|uniref:Uncharacterized protein n=1 Tax=Phytophthora nicotianae TaxID=4792 RepID=W2J5M9_PHYNI|nr:hypothetical protein L915_07467 [Phytophthora nicotianae]ETL41671.1 hypothetical protein L916_07405 [Phytophthora nicotianae]